jgi:hypothetical protein
MSEGVREVLERIGLVLGIFAGVWVCLWFSWDSFLILLGLPSLNWYQALGATILVFLIFGAVYLLKEDFRE